MHLNAIVHHIILSWILGRVGKKELFYNCKLKASFVLAVRQD